MARNSKVQVNSSNQKPKDPVSDSNAKKTRSMDETLVSMLWIFNWRKKLRKKFEQCSNLCNLIECSRSGYELFTPLRNTVKRSVVADRSMRRVNPIPILQMSDNEVDSDPSGYGDNVCNVKNLVKIDLEDVQSEVDFWNSSIIFYVVGASPPPYVMEGFIRRIWKNNGVDKVALLKNGVYIVRFLSMEKKDYVLTGSVPFFDNKPVIVRAWEQDMDVTKDQFDFIPTWIQLRLDFKYWSERCLNKLVSSLGKFVKVDTATAKREKLQYARVMVEVKIHLIN